MGGFFNDRRNKKLGERKKRGLKKNWNRGGERRMKGRPGHRHV